MLAHIHEHPSLWFCHDCLTGEHITLQVKTQMWPGEYLEPPGRLMVERSYCVGCNVGGSWTALGGTVPRSEREMV